MDEKRAKESVEISAHEQYIEDKCEYCDGVYVHGLHLICPHCGAPIRPANQPIEVQGFNDYYD
ncbi:MAG: hypothetical protein IJ833_00950 [Lachnospiraceae bacterium]|nr:hypothetical protein [Lachnospiraceae bacterium]